MIFKKLFLLYSTHLVIREMVLKQILLKLKINNQFKKEKREKTVK